MGPSSTDSSSAVEFFLENPNLGLIWLGRALVLLTLSFAVLAVLSFNLIFMVLAVSFGLLARLVFKPMVVLYLSAGENIVELTRYNPLLGLGRGRKITLGVRRLSFLRGADVRAAQSKKGNGYTTGLRFDAEETLELRSPTPDAATQIEIAEAIRDFVRPRVISVRKP